MRLGSINGCHRSLALTGLVCLLAIKVGAQVQQELDPFAQKTCLRCFEKAKSKDCSSCQDWILLHEHRMVDAEFYPLTFIAFTSKALAARGFIEDAQKGIRHAPRLLSLGFDKKK